MSYIQRAINSVLMQTFSPDELIIIDDGSTDSSYKVAGEIQDHRVRIISQENLGVSAARNRGVSEAISEWVAFLDADDEWKPNFLATAVDFSKEHENCSLIATYYEKLVDNNNVIDSYFPAFPGKWRGKIEDYYSLMCIGEPFNSSSVVVQKKLLLKIGGFPENLHHFEDIVTWIKLSLISDFGYINDPLSIYHIEYSNSASQGYLNLEQIPPVTLLLELLRSNQIAKTKRASTKDLISKLQFRTIRKNLKAGNRLSALRLLINCRGSKLYRKKWLSLVKETLFLHKND